jgi:invasion protein IalB
MKLESCRFLTVLLVLACLGMPALAQPQADADAETATFGDWTVRCSQKEGAPPCDIVQFVRQKDTGRTIMQVSFGYIPGQDKYPVQFVLPLGFLLSSGATIRIDDKTDLKDYPVTRCEAQGCLIEKTADAKDLAPFRAGKIGTVTVTAAAGRMITFPISFTGFTRALDEMTAKNKKHAGITQPSASTPKK